MYRNRTLSKKIDMFLEDVFWVSYILFIVLAPVVSAGIFVTVLYTTILNIWTV